MKLKALGHKLGMVTLTAMMAMTTVMANTTSVKADTAAIDTSGTMGSMISTDPVTSADSDGAKIKNVVEFNMLNGKLRVTFLKDNEFRLNFEKTGNEFVKNAKPYVDKNYNKVFIINKYATDYTGVEPTISEDTDNVYLTTTKIKLSINKTTALMKLTDIKGNVKWEEAEPIKIVNDKATQTLKTTEDEYFYGGGTQNGYFSHKNTKLKIEIGGGWEDGGRSNPVPFYMSTKGYSVMRHTFTPGEYDFSSTATFTHNEDRFDAYYFVNDDLKDHLNSFTELTGRPVFYPRWAEYVGHADCYNYNKNTGERDLNNQGKKVLDKYLEENNVPLGWMLVNDGYGCHYGKTGNVDGNIQNLKTFVDYASSKGVETGLWTQSKLMDESASVLRNIDKEVKVAGTRAIKTDVAWVGAGYDMQMNSVNSAYQGIAQSGDRPFIFSLYGWAGSQRYAGMWTGDQTGGRWEYIRFMIPSYIGSGLSAQPNVGSDIDSIYKGSKTIATRDAQWKAFTPLLYYMGGWDGSKADELDGKTPWEYGTDSKAIVQFYLKTRAELTPYNYTISNTASLNGTPMLRAMVLEFPNDPYTYGKETQYQYMWGENLLVAPVYEGTGKDTDVGYRNGIYLPDADQTWIDYFTGEQYQGGKTINNFDAPLWKLPLFVKSGAILPMTEENNASLEITDDKDRIFNIYPDGDTSFDLFEDDGHSIGAASATTKITSSAPELVNGKASDGTATIKIEKRAENAGYAALDKATELLINTHKKPSKVTLKFNGTEQTLTEVTKEQYQTAVKNGDDTKNIYYYDENYNLAKYDGSEYINGGNAVNPGPRLVLRTVKTDVSETAMEVSVEGFNNSGYVDPGVGNAPTTAPTFETPEEAVITPTSITLKWNAVQEATSYDLRINGKDIFTNVSVAGTTTYLHKDLPNKTEYTYEVRAVNKFGASGWSDSITVSTKENPFKYSPEKMTVSWDPAQEAYSGSLADLVDKNMGTQYHSASGAINKGLVIDMQYAYSINSFVYVPRQDYSGTGGNGVVQKLDLELSIDGKTWKKVKEDYIVNAGTIQPMFNNVYADVMTFDVTMARYVRLTPKSSVGTFFTAQEVIPCFIEGSKPRTAGSPLEHTNPLSDSDLVTMKMYSGSIPGDDTWNQVESADANYNKISDAYDLVNITSQLDGGVKPSADKAIDGTINTTLSKSTAMNTNDTVRVDIVGSGLKDINALSAEFAFDNTKFEVVDKDANFFGASVETLGMADFSRYNPHGAASTNPTVYIDLANRGNKARLNGDVVIGSFYLKATQDNVTPEVTTKNALIVNSNMIQKNAKTEDFTPTDPVVKQGRVDRKDIVEIDFKTSGIEHDDGTVLMQNGKAAVESLFDNNLNSTMEFKWSRPDDEKVVLLPVEMNFKFNEAKKIKFIEVYNRASGNGKILEMQAIGYKGTEAFDLGNFTIDNPITNGSGYDVQTNRYLFTAESGKDVFTSVKIIAKKASNMTTLTLRELVFQESNEVDVNSITASCDDNINMFAGKLKSANITVGPNNALNKNVTISVDNPSVVSAKLAKDGEGNTVAMLQSLAAGTAKVTVASVSNPTVKKEINVTVKDGIDTSSYEKFVKFANDAIAMGDYYQKDGLDAMKAEYDKVLAMDLEAVSQNDLDTAVLNLVKAYNALLVRETNPKELIKGTELKATTEFYSESNVGSNVLDDDLKTFWETPYAGANVGLPKAIVLELPKVSTIRQLDYVPTQVRNGLITEYELYVSTDNMNYTKVSEGAYNRDAADYGVREMKFTSVQAKYVKFIPTKALGRIADEDNKYARVAELRLYGVCDATSITVNPTEVELKLGETKAITSTLNPTYAKDTLSWTSSDTSVATVSDKGVITAVANGEVDITVSGTSASATVSVKVNSLRDITATIKVADDFVNTIETPFDVYTKTTWEAFTKALADAKAITATATQANVDAAETALKTAKDNLLELTTVEKLLRKVEAAKEITNTDATYSVGSFSALQTVITEVEAVANKAGATEDELAVANKKLADAVAGLVNIKELREAIAKVTTPEGDYSTASKAAFDKILADANTLLANENCKDADVKATITALGKINSKLVNVANLRAEITKTKEFLNANGAKFTPSYKANLEGTILASEKVMANALTAKQVSDALSKLKVMASSPLYKGNKAQLETALSSASKFVKNAASYTKVSYKAFESALNAAQKVLGDENAVQSTIDRALASLTKAQKGLVKVSGGKPVVSGPTIKNPAGNITVTGKLPNNTKVITVEKTAKEINTILNTIKDKEMLRKYTFERIFDIHLMKDGVSYKADGTMIVKIKLDKALLNKDLGVVYIDGKGNTEEMKSTVKNGYIEFETTHFSTYAIVSKNKNYTGGVKTGDTTNAALWMMLAVLGGGYIAIRAYKKSKEA